jgi:iron(III) transport system permease protein
VRRDPVVAPAVLLVWGAVALFVLYPLGRLLVLTFWNDGPSLDAVRGLVGDWTHRAALVNSLLLAALVGIAGTVLGFAFALLAVRANLPRWCSRALDAVVLLPLISPPFTAAIALIFALGPRGLISYHVFGLTRVNIYGLWGTLLSETLTYFPIAYLTLKAVLANVDANLEDSAFSLGARRWRVFRTVTLPLTTPGVANAFLLVSAASLADFATPLILAGTRFPVLPTQAFLQITGLYDMRGGAALCFLLLVPALAVFAGQRWFTERRGGTFVTVTGKVGAVTRVKSLSPAAVLGLAAGCGLVVVLVLVCYLLIFAASIVRGLGADNSLSLAHYAHVFSGGLKAVRDTLVIAAICMPVGGLFAVVLGFLVSRTQFPGRRALEFVAMMNYALPGTIVGIAYLVAFNDPPLALTGTAFILVVCYVFRYSLAGTRATSAVLAQIDPSIEEASASLGARRDVTFRRVVLPLIRPALLAGMTVLFIRGMTAISATIFLVSLDWSLVTVRILEGITNLELGQASAFSMVVIALVYLAVAVASLAMRRLNAGSLGQAGTLLGG